MGRKILKNAGLPPTPDRPTPWRVLLRAHWPALRAADFFTTEVWSVRGLVTYRTLSYRRRTAQELIDHPPFNERQAPSSASATRWILN